MGRSIPNLSSGTEIARSSLRNIQCSHS
jgi:hypothetical protein